MTNLPTWTKRQKRGAGVPNCYKWDPVSPGDTPPDYAQRSGSLARGFPLPLSHHLHRFQLTFELVSDRTVVSVLEYSTGILFIVGIPADYYPHLAWIQRESMEGSSRAKWLQNALDHFAEELRSVSAGVDSSWRSRSLHCLILRAFYSIPDDDEAAIATAAKVQINPRLKNLTQNDWMDFYSLIDPINPSYNERWKGIKPQGFRDEEATTTESPHPDPMERPPGMWGCIVLASVKECLTWPFNCGIRECYTAAEIWRYSASGFHGRGGSTVRAQSALARGRNSRRSS